MPLFDNSRESSPKTHEAETKKSSRRRWQLGKKRVPRRTVYRSGWKWRRDEHKDWINKAGSRVRRRLHSSSLTPHNTFAKQASPRHFFFLYFAVCSCLVAFFFFASPFLASSLYFCPSTFLFLFVSRREETDNQKQCVSLLLTRFRSERTHTRIRFFLFFLFFFLLGRERELRNKRIPRETQKGEFLRNFHFVWDFKTLDLLEQ